MRATAREGPRLTVTVSPGRPWLVDCYDTWLQRLQVPVAAPSGPRLRQAQGPGGGTSRAVGWGELPGVNAGWGQAWDQGASQARAVCRGLLVSPTAASLSGPFPVRFGLPQGPPVRSLGPAVLKTTAGPAPGSLGPGSCSRGEWSAGV